MSSFLFYTYIRMNIITQMESLSIQEHYDIKLKNSVIYASIISHLVHFRYMSVCSIMFCIFFV